jgi:hypothetical protein
MVLVVLMIVVLLEQQQSNWMTFRFLAILRARAPRLTLYCSRTQRATTHNPRRSVISRRARTHTHTHTHTHTCHAEAWQIRRRNKAKDDDAPMHMASVTSRRKRLCALTVRV